MARRINPFLVESGLTEKEADLDGLFVPDVHRRPTSRATAADAERPTPPRPADATELRRRQRPTRRRPVAAAERRPPAGRPGAAASTAAAASAARSASRWRIGARRRSASPRCSSCWVRRRPRLDGAAGVPRPDAGRDVGRRWRELWRDGTLRERPRGRRCGASLIGYGDLGRRSASWSASPSARSRRSRRSSSRRSASCATSRPAR